MALEESAAYDAKANEIRAMFQDLPDEERERLVAVYMDGYERGRSDYY